MVEIAEKLRVMDLSEFDPPKDPTPKDYALALYQIHEEAEKALVSKSTFGPGGFIQRELHEVLERTMRR